ncbi:Thermophilic serine proteinase precursor [compost metagenome]
MKQRPFRLLTLLASAFLIGCQSPSTTPAPFGVTLTQNPSPQASLPDALTGGRPLPRGSYVPDELIVKLAAGADRSAALQGFTLQGELHLPERFVGVKLPAGMTLSEAHAVLSERPGVSDVSLNLMFNAASTAPAPARLGEQWAHRVAETTTYWQASPPAATSDVIVAVIDSGLDMTHPEFQGRIVAPQNFTEENDGTLTDPTDRHKHGTHVAGIIGAKGDQVVGVAPHVSIMPIKVLDMNNAGSTMDIVKGMAYACGLTVVDFDAQQNPVPRKTYREYLPDGDARHVRVMNMSLGSASHGRNALYEAALAQAYALGIVVVVAAGNDGSDVTAPANSPYSLAVSSTSSYRLGSQLWEWLSGFSNRGDQIELSAPGGQILSTLPTYPYEDRNGIAQPQGFGYLSGTSMAAPYVAGVAALVVEKFPPQVGDTPTGYVNKVRQHLAATSDDLGAPGKDPKYGWGRVNVRKALTATSFPAPLP